MATQVSLNDGAVASAGALAIQTNGTTQAVSISTGQVATLAQNPILTSGTANGVAYLNGSKAVTSGSTLTWNASSFGIGTTPLTNKLAVVGDATNYGILSSNPSGYGAINIRSNTITAQTWSFIANDNGANSDLLLYGGSSAGTKLVIDSGGNLLVGTTGLGTIGSSSGSTITASGAIYSASTGESIFARRSSNGDLLLFRRDTTGVGSIAVTTTGVTLTGTNGITFTAAQAASADANTLDDYEEGTWTATLTGSTAAPTTPITTTAIYTKIGRLVTISFVFNNVNTTGATGNIRITGLPFTIISNNNEPNGTCVMAAQGSNAGGLNGITAQSYAEVWNLTTLNAIAITATTGVYIRGTLTYNV